MTFSELLGARLGTAMAGGAEPLAQMPYAEELALKQAALQAFWQQERLGGTVEPVVASVLPRGYRTTTKRRVGWWGAGKLALDFAECRQPGVCASSLLEPAAHQAVYQACFDRLLTPPYQALARALNWIIIRGSYTRLAVILNVAGLDAAVVRKAKLLGDHLAAANLGVDAAMLYVDPTRSGYYLEAERPTQGLESKHLFGPRLLTLAFDDGGTAVRLKYPLTGFSQVNEAMVPALVSHARELLATKPQDRLLDLYCGYGLFSFTLGRECRDVVGVEIGGESIAVAVETAQRQGVAGRVRFAARRITAAALPGVLPPPPPPQGGGMEALLLDPPRQGAEAGVITVLAKRRPRRVLQICCGTEAIAPAVTEWRAAGYAVARVRALDLFAGTPNLETLLELKPISQ